MILQSDRDLKKNPLRIVSLVPSQTELLHFLRLEKETIAITKFCVHPQEWRKSKIIIGGTKQINIRLIKSLQPDLIIANKEENLKEEVEELAHEFPVWLTDVSNLADAMNMIKSVARLTNRTQEGEKLADDISQAFSRLPFKNALLPSGYLIWREPYMTVGGDTFIHDMMIRCGLQNVFSHRTRYPEITLAAIKETNCRLLLLSSEPYPFNQRHIGELQVSLPGITILLADGEMFSWYGSRLLLVPGYFEMFWQNMPREMRCTGRS